MEVTTSQIKKYKVHEIGRWVFVTRVRAGLTQAQLARKVGTKQPSIARLETSRRLPSLRFICKIAEALGENISVVFK